MEILVKMHTDIPVPEKKDKCDWIDLRAAEDVVLRAGESKLISLGISMQLPDGYGALLVPRSSLYKRTGLLQANSVGVFESSYCGDDDVWGFWAYATRDTRIYKGDRICQFMLYPLPPAPAFKQVDHLPGENRGGWGSTGVNEYTPGSSKVTRYVGPDGRTYGGGGGGGGGIGYTDKYGNVYYIPGKTEVRPYKPEGN
jgi:dUTP pyrophosphatase